MFTVLGTLFGNVRNSQSHTDSVQRAKRSLIWQFRVRKLMVVIPCLLPQERACQRISLWETYKIKVSPRDQEDRRGLVYARSGSELQWKRAIGSSR